MPAWISAAKITVVIVVLAWLLTSTGLAAPADVCSQSIAPFHRVDALLDSIPSKWISTQRQTVWDEASRVLHMHERDRMPRGCRDVDAFEIAKIHAQMHLLDFSSPSNSQTLQQRWDIAAQLWLSFFNALVDRHPTEDQRRQFRLRFAKPFAETVGWRNDLMLNGATPPPALMTNDASAHFPTSQNCQIKTLEAVASNPSIPDVTSGTKGHGTITALVRVYLDENGKVTKAILEDSSGVDQYDQSVMDAAKRSTYLPAVRDCRRVPGMYLFRATYSGG